MHYGPWMGGGWLMMAVWWLVIVVAIIFVVRWVVDQRSSPSRPDSAMDVLKRRYANGEISKEEFEEKRKAIQS